MIQPPRVNRVGAAPRLVARAARLGAGCVLAALIGLGTVHAAVPGSIAEQVVRESGLAVQIQQVPEAVSASMAETGQALGLPAGLAAQMQREGQRAFQPKRLVAATVSSAARDLDATTAAEALRWWRGADGQKVRAI